MSFPARYPGLCPSCEERWQPGDLIRADRTTSEGLPRWTHAVCPDARAEPLHGKQCPDCHLTMPLTGICDCKE